MLIVPTLPPFQCDLIRGFSLAPSLHRSAALSLCSLFLAQRSQTRHSQGICSSLSPYIPRPVCSAPFFPPPFYGMRTRLAFYLLQLARRPARAAGQYLAGQRNLLGSSRAGAEAPAQTWLEGIPPTGVITPQKAPLRWGPKGLLLYAKHTLKAPWLMEGPGGRGKRNGCPCHGSASATVVRARNHHTGQRSLRGLTPDAASVTDFIQGRLHLSYVCHILFPRAFPVSATMLTVTCEAAPLGRGVCPHGG